MPVLLFVVHVVGHERSQVLALVPWLWCTGGRDRICERGSTRCLAPPHPGVESHDGLRKGDGEGERLVVGHDELLRNEMIKSG